MSYADHHYFNLCCPVINQKPEMTFSEQELTLGLSEDDVGAQGILPDRTGTGMIAGLPDTRRYWASHFPLLTTKRVHFRSVKEELLWMIAGDTNIRRLVQNKVNIWNEWPYEAYRKNCIKRGVTPLTIKGFIEKIKEDKTFSDKFGNLGRVYGAQWRGWQVGNKRVDQLQDIIDILKSPTPYSRRLIMSGWNVADIPDMALPPCHTLYQFTVIGQTLHLTLYQRSGDIFLGIPFNIASATLLLRMVAQVTGYHAGSLTHLIACPHIYANHVDMVREQLARSPDTYGCPTLRIDGSIKHIDDFKSDSIILEGYESYSSISAPVAV